jgi:hypothetical protein
MTGKDRKSEGNLYEVETKGRTMGKKERHDKGRVKRKRQMRNKSLERKRDRRKRIVWIGRDRWNRRVWKEE